VFSGSRKVWLSQAHLNEVSRAISNLVSESPGDAKLLALHDEIAVAGQRYAQASGKPGAMSKALGREEGDIPLTLTADEAECLYSALATSGSTAHSAREALLSGLL